MAEPTSKSACGIPQADGTTKWWELTDQWREVKTDPSFVDGVTGEYEGTITKIKVVNGVVTEVEVA